MKVTSKELIQSYVLTTAKYNFSKYEKLILYRLIELAQADLEGKKLDKTYVIGETLFKDKIIKMPATFFMTNDEIKNKNNSQVKKALERLNDKKIIYDDGTLWKVIRIIEKPEFKRGIVQFEVQPMMWEAILNFHKGFSKYELETAMSFESVFAMRFYELFSNNLQPLTFSIEDLKERFGLQNKYKNRPADFINKAIITAKKELDEKSPYSFDFVPLKTGRKITAIKFLPYKTNNPESIEPKKLNQQMSLRWDFSREFINWLKNKGFNDKGIKANKDILIEFYKTVDSWDDWLITEVPRYKTASNPQGYIIGAIKNYLKNKNNPDKKRIDNLINNVANKLKP